MSEAVDQPNVAPSSREKAKRAHYDASVIVDILGVIASSDISGTRKVCGTQIEYLAQQLTGALAEIEEGCKL